MTCIGRKISLSLISLSHTHTYTSPFSSISTYPSQSLSLLTSITPSYIKALSDIHKCTSLKHTSLAPFCPSTSLSIIIHYLLSPPHTYPPLCGVFFPVSETCVSGALMYSVTLEHFRLVPGNGIHTLYLTNLSFHVCVLLFISFNSTQYICLFIHLFIHLFNPVSQSSVLLINSFICSIHPSILSFIRPRKHGTSQHQILSS